MGVPGGLIAALLGGGAALGLVVLARRRVQPDPSGDKPTGTTDPCEYLKGVHEGAYVACKSLGGAAQVIAGVTQALDGRDSAAIEANNRAKNGEPELMLGALSKGVRTVVSSTGQQVRRALRGETLRFKNGCVPFEGAPGWEKCAPGTKSNLADGSTFTTISQHGVDGFASMVREGKHQFHDYGVISSNPPGWDRAFTGDQGDPFTQGPYQADGTLGPDAAGTGASVRWGGDLGGASRPFPIPLAPGEVGYYCAGKPMKCPADAPELAPTRDQQGNVTCACTRVKTERTEEAADWLEEQFGISAGVVSFQSGTRIEQNVCGDDPNFILDRLPDGTTYCRRKMRGE